MGERGQRIPETLRRLVLSFLPRQLPGEDNEASADRIQDAFDRTQSILDSYASPSPPDVNQVQELIQRKLLRENESPAKAAKFNNFYSRLLSIPVIKEKWSLLFFLYSLSTLVDKETSIEDPLQGGNHPEIVRLRENLQKRRDMRNSASPSSRAKTDRGLDGKMHEGDSGVPSQNVNSKGQQESGGASRTQREVDNPIDDKAPFLDNDYRFSPAESVLLRDLPYNLQGLSSENLKFTSPASIKLPQTLPVPLVSLLHTLAEPCLLYRQLSDFTAGSGGGLVSQSLRAAVSVELRSHLTLVASLEGEIRRSLAAVQKEESLAVRKAAVTLRRCVVWTRDATMGLRLLSLVVEQSKEKRGGQVISLVHSFSSSHGDPFVAAYAERLLTHVTRPFYDMLRQWIYDGELTDPFHEFFVIEQDPNRHPEIDPRKVSTSVWEDKFKLDDSMVPSIIFADFAKKVFLIGKSLNFIRHNCSDSDWVNEYSRSASRELRYGDTETLESSIDEAYKSTMTRLISLMSHKYHVFTHLEALKKYMLISQGDFITLLIESLAIHLDRPANAQYRHVLNSQLEHAIRHSNAQYDNEEVLKRLDARIMALSSGDIAWEAFTLEYKITAPCDVIITQWANTQYLRVFNLLWRIKRVEFSLSSTWRRSMTGSRGILAAVNDRVGPDWKKARCVMSEMIHFVNQLLYYILFEVIESSWEKLQEAISKPESTLDDLIAAHNDYLNEITSKGLLSTQARSQERNHLNQIYEIFKIMLGYKDAVDTLYSFSVAEFTRRQEFSAKIEQRTAQGRWGITESDMLRGDSRSSGAGTPVMMERPRSDRLGAFPLDETDSPLLPPANKVASADDRVLDGLRIRMSSLGTDFKKAISVFLGDLARQPDVDVRFLGVVMNFNDVYKPVHLHRSKQSSTARSR